MRNFLIVILGLILLGCSEDYQQQISSKSFQSNEITNGVLKVYTFSGGVKGKLLKSFTLAKENLSFDGLNISDEPILLELTDFEYLDPYTNQKIVMGSDDHWSSIISRSYENSIDFQINPITTLFTDYVIYLTQEKHEGFGSAFEIASIEFNKHFGNINLMKNSPVKPTGKSVSEDNVYYLALISLAKLSSHINSSIGSVQPYTPNNFLKDLESDIEDGFFDGKNFSRRIDTGEFFFDSFVFNYKLHDYLNEFLDEVDASYKAASEVKTLLNSLNRNDRAFFKQSSSVDNQGPKVGFARPMDGFAVGNNFHIIINFTDQSGEIPFVEVLYDNVPVGDINPSDFVFESYLNNLGVPNGPRELTVSATDKFGNVTTQTIHVISDNTNPVIDFRIDNQIPNQNSFIGGIVNLKAVITDNNGVDFISLNSNNAEFNAMLNDVDAEKAIFQAVVNTKNIIQNGTKSLILTVKGSDYAGNSVKTDYNLTIDNRGPVVTLLYPKVEKSFHNGDTIQAKADTNNGVNTLTASLIVGNIFYTLADSNSLVDVFNHLVNFNSISDAPAILRFEASDLKNNVSVTDFNVSLNNNFFDSVKRSNVSQSNFSFENSKITNILNKKHLQVINSGAVNNQFSVFMSNDGSPLSLPAGGGTMLFGYPIDYLSPSEELQSFNVSSLNIVDVGDDNAIESNEKVTHCDINGDGADDMAFVSNYYLPGLSAVNVQMGPYFNNGSWPIDFSLTWPVSGVHLDDLDCHDFNEDGFADLYFNYTIHWGPNLTSKTDLKNYLPGVSDVAGFYGVFDAFESIGDVNGDGKNDFVFGVTSVGIDYYMVVYGPITGVPLNFSAPLSGSAYQFSELKQIQPLGDIDQDGFDDFVMGMNVITSTMLANDSFRIFYGKPQIASVFVSSNIFPNNAQSPYFNFPFKTCDIDGNGFKDIIFKDYTPSNYSTSRMGYLLGPSFEQEGFLQLSGNATNAFDCKDINYDNKDDIIVLTTNGLNINNSFSNAPVPAVLEVHYDSR